MVVVEEGAEEEVEEEDLEEEEEVVGEAGDKEAMEPQPLTPLTLAKAILHQSGEPSLQNKWPKLELLGLQLVPHQGRLVP